MTARASITLLYPRHYIAILKNSGPCKHDTTSHVSDLVGFFSTNASSWHSHNLACVNDSVKQKPYCAPSAAILLFPINCV